MTPRSVITVDFKEIRAVEVRCKCGAVMSLPLPKTRLGEHFACIGCNTTLWVDQDYGGDYVRVQSLLRGLSAWHEADKPPFTLGFSLEAAARDSGGKD